MPQISDLSPFSEFTFNINLNVNNASDFESLLSKQQNAMFSFATACG